MLHFYISSKMTYHLSAILIGVVRQDVKRSAGSSGFIGSSSLEPQAANWIQFLAGGGIDICVRDAMPDIWG